MHEIRKRTPLERVHDAVFGPDGEPEKGLVQIIEDLKKDVQPIIRLFNGAKWPLGIVVAGLLSALVGWLVNVFRMIMEVLP